MIQGFGFVEYLERLKGLNLVECLSWGGSWLLNDLMDVWTYRPFLVTSFCRRMVVINSGSHRCW